MYANGTWDLDGFLRYLQDQGEIVINATDDVQARETIHITENPPHNEENYDTVIEMPQNVWKRGVNRSAHRLRAKS